MRWRDPGPVRHTPGFIKPLRREPRKTWRATLASFLRKIADGIRLSDHDLGRRRRRFSPRLRHGTEGIVAKRRDRPYRSGRCTDWIKVKTGQLGSAASLGF
jgi:bifunctional non-homologous end joining protein LigD